MQTEKEHVFRHSFYPSTIKFAIHETLHLIPFIILLRLSLYIGVFLEDNQSIISIYPLILFYIFFIGLVFYFIFRLIVPIMVLLYPLMFSSVFIYILITENYFSDLTIKGIFADVFTIFLYLLFCLVLGFLPAIIIQPPKSILIRTDGKTLRWNIRKSKIKEFVELHGRRELIVHRKVSCFPVKQARSREFRIISRKYEFWKLQLRIGNKIIELIDSDWWLKDNREWYLTTDSNTFSWIQELIHWFAETLDFQIRDQTSTPRLTYTYTKSFPIVDQVSNYRGLGFSMKLDDNGKTPQTFTPTDIVNQVSDHNYSYQLKATESGYLCKMYPKYPYSVFPKLMKLFEGGFLLIWCFTVLEWVFYPNVVPSKVYFQHLISMIVLTAYLLYRHLRYMSLEIDQDRIILAHNFFRLNYNSHHIKLNELIGVVQSGNKVEFVGKKNRLQISGELHEEEVKELIINIMYILQFVCNFSKLIAYDVHYYHCPSCNLEIETGDFHCPNCSVPPPKCIICYLQAFEHHQVAMYECCQSIAHLEHARQWNEVKNYCPYCRTENPIVQIIEN